MPEEIVSPFPPLKSHPASEMRSTLLTTSIQSLRAHGHLEQYTKTVSKEYRDAILTTVAGIWLPLAIGIAHYTACDRLNLPPSEQFAIGKEVGDRVQGTILGLLVRTAKQAGLTPWTGLSSGNRMYERLFVGGGVCLTKLGPKEARLEVVNNQLFGLAYFRNGFRGIVATGAELFCEKAYVHELPKLTSATSLGMRVSWA